MEAMNAKAVSDLLKSRGVRPTPQRILVYQYLREHPVHATADTVYDALLPENPTFSRTTVYNSIRTLTESGLIHPVTIDGGFIRYDANVADHGHFKCIHCGKIFDFQLEQKPENPSSLKDFRILTRDCYLCGTCPTCTENVSAAGE